MSATASRALRILLVSQMWPGPDDPDLGTFVAQVDRELSRLGHDVVRAVLEGRAGGKLRHGRLLRRAVALAGRERPDVVFGHFLFPAGAAAAAAARRAGVPYVLMAHGQDVANVRRGALRPVAAPVVRGAAAIIVNSHWLAAELDDALAGEGRRAHVIDCGVDLSVFAPRDAGSARREVGWSGEGPRFLFVGSLIERKNVVRLADAFSRVGRGQLALLGDGPLRPALENRPGVQVVGRVDHDRVPAWMAAADVLCLPSLREPLGQVVLEAMAMERSVVATTAGGASEFVEPGTGVLVDPDDTGALASALEAALELPSPNRRARRAAEGHDARRQAQRMAQVLERAVGPSA